MDEAEIAYDGKMKSELGASVGNYGQEQNLPQPAGSYACYGARTY